jgi:hypothetical protein
MQSRNRLRRWPVAGQLAVIVAVSCAQRPSKCGKQFIQEMIQLGREPAINHRMLYPIIHQFRFHDSGEVLFNVPHRHVDLALAEPAFTPSLL